MARAKQNQDPKPLVALAVVVRGNKVLLIRRANPEGDLIWAFPGGKVEPNENSKAASRREVFEEANIECKPLRRLGRRIHPDTKHKIDYFFCQHRRGEGEPAEKHKIAEVKWATLDEMKDTLKLDVFSPVLDYLTDAFKNDQPAAVSAQQPLPLC